MPIIKSAKKAARQAEKRRDNNQQIKKTIRGALKEFHAKPTAEKLAIVQSEYDKAVKKGLMKKNTANRRKAKLAAFAKASNVKVAAAKKAAPKAKSAPKAEKPAAKKAPAKKTAVAKKPAAKKTTAKKAEK
ncbi:MAG: 30S ribosomal protein S20 [Candidatus Saccharibacteria bacterium]|nr:30S ribosomal protein S20 [Candidatus Saccharibacteria bacterium]